MVVLSEQASLCKVPEGPSDSQSKNWRDYPAIACDLLLRESWANRANLLDANLDVDEECFSVSKAMAEEARAGYDKANKGGTKVSNGRGWRDYSSAFAKQKL